METTLTERLARVERRSTCRLTHYGRRTGRAYEVTIWFLVHGETVYLVTANMRRQWPRNVQANPTVQLRVGGDNFSGTITPITDPGEIARVVALLRKKYWLARLYLLVKGRPDGAFRVALNP